MRARLRETLRGQPDGTGSADPGHLAPSLARPSPQSAMDEDADDAQLQRALEESRREEERRQSSVQRCEADDLARATRESLAGRAARAEALSYQYWSTACLNVDDAVCDGFYEVFGEFPEAARPGAFPSLGALRCIVPRPGVRREVLLVDRASDPALVEAEREAIAAVAEAAPAGEAPRVRALAQLVAGHMGGPQSNTPVAAEKWLRLVSRIKMERSSVVIPIGELYMGGSRHRCLLFKALADELGISCRLVKGRFYAEGDNDAQAIVVVDGGEMYVDLLVRPGDLTPIETGLAQRNSSRGSTGYAPSSSAGTPQQLSPQPSSEHPLLAVKALHQSPVPSASPASGSGAARAPSDSPVPSVSSSPPQHGSPLSCSPIDPATRAMMLMPPPGSSRAGAFRPSPIEPAAPPRVPIDEVDLINLQSPAAGASLMAIMAAEATAPGSAHTAAHSTPGTGSTQSHGPSPSTADAGSGGQPRPPARRRQTPPDWQPFGDDDDASEVPGSSSSAVHAVPSYAQQQQEPSPRALPSGELRFSFGGSHSRDVAAAAASAAEQQRAGYGYGADGLPFGSPLGRQGGLHTAFDVEGSEISFSNGLGELRVPPIAVPRLAATRAVPAPSSVGGSPPGHTYMPAEPSASAEIAPGLLQRPHSSQSVRFAPSPAAVAQHPLAASGAPPPPRPPSSSGGSPRSSPMGSQRLSSSLPKAQSALAAAELLQAAAVRAASSRGGAGLTDPLTELSPLMAHRRVAPSAVPGGPPMAAMGSRGQQSSLDEDLPGIAATRRSSDMEATTAGSTPRGQAGSVTSPGGPVASPFVLASAGGSGRGPSPTRPSSGRATDRRGSPSDARPAGGAAPAPAMPGSGSTTSLAGMSEEMPEEWEIDAGELMLGPRIGIGSYGEVYRGQWRQTDVAVKRFLEQEVSEGVLEEFKAEVSLMRRLRHPNILQFMGACTAPPNLCIVTQYIPRGSLFKLLHRTPGFQPDERRRLQMALDIARGMNYLHTCRPPVIHRDLKTPNLLVDKDLTIKVCDFGLSRVRRSTWLSTKSQAGTPEWTAPEVLRSQSYNEKSDVYSWGVILWELVTNEEPWADKGAMQVVGAVGWGHERLPIPADARPDVQELIARCFADQSKRPSFAEIIPILKRMIADLNAAAAAAAPK